MVRSNLIKQLLILGRLPLTNKSHIFEDKRGRHKLDFRETWSFASGFDDDVCLKISFRSSEAKKENDAYDINTPIHTHTHTHTQHILYI